MNYEIMNYMGYHTYFLCPGVYSIASNIASILSKAEISICFESSLFDIIHNFLLQKLRGKIFRLLFIIVQILYTCEQLVSSKYLRLGLAKPSTT